MFHNDGAGRQLSRARPTRLDTLIRNPDLGGIEITPTAKGKVRGCGMRAAIGQIARGILHICRGEPGGVLRCQTGFNGDPSASSGKSSLAITISILIVTRLAISSH